MAAMTSFHAEKCRHLVSEHEAAAGAHAAAFRQFLIYSTAMKVLVASTHFSLLQQILIFNSPLMVGTLF